MIGLVSLCTISDTALEEPAVVDGSFSLVVAPAELLVQFIILSHR